MPSKNKTLAHLRREIALRANKKQAAQLQRFFKTGKGEYGEGDVFLGLTVPTSRALAKRFVHLPLSDIAQLLKSKKHEERLIALLLLVSQFEGGDEAKKKDVYTCYLQNTSQVNNWDLVDLTAHKIVGEYLVDRSRKKLYSLARSRNMWEQRIAIIATAAFIRRDDFNDTLNISDILLFHEHDLIHKAVGWMLREVGKRNQSVEERFLKSRYKTMPRTMLRYAIEKFSEQKRKRYLKGLI